MTSVSQKPLYRNRRDILSNHHRTQVFPGVFHQDQGFFQVKYRKAVFRSSIIFGLSKLSIVDSCAISLTIGGFHVT